MILFRGALSYTELMDMTIPDFVDIKAQARRVTKELTS